MGRKARYCCFHSMEGSGAQCRNAIICGVTLEDCLRDEEMADKVTLLCPSFLHYGVSTPGQTRELKEVQERATRMGRRHEFTIRKLYHIHEQTEWNWKEANKKIRESLRGLEQRTQHDTEMKDILNNIVHNTTMPDSVLEFWQQLIPSAGPSHLFPTMNISMPAVVSGSQSNSVAPVMLLNVPELVPSIHSFDSHSSYELSSSSALGVPASASASLSSSSSSSNSSSASHVTRTLSEMLLTAGLATQPSVVVSMPPPHLHQDLTSPSLASVSRTVSRSINRVSSSSNVLSRAPVSRTSSGTNVLSRASISRTSSGTSIFDWCKANPEMFAAASNLHSQLGRTQ